MHIHGCKQTPKTPPTTSDEESSGSSSDAEMKKKKGNRAMGKKKFPKAKKYYSKAIKVDPSNATYRLNRAIANAKLELWKDAEVDAAKAVELDEKPNPKSHYQLARARLQRGCRDEARDTIEAALQVLPEEAALLQLQKEIERAIAAQAAKLKRAEEEKAARPVATVGPSAVSTMLEEARTAYQAGRLEQAVELLKDVRATVSSALAAKPEDSAQLHQDETNALALLAKANMQLRRWPEAAAAFQGVVEVEEKTLNMDKKEHREALSNAYNNLGIARKNAGLLPEAVEALQAAYLRATNGDDEVATPQTSQILQNLGQCFRARKMPEEARRYYERALGVAMRYFPDDHSSHALNYTCIGRCLRDENKVKEAIEAFTKAMEIWMAKKPEECLRELPEVPNQARLEQLQQQTKQELAQLVILVEQAREAALRGGQPAEAAPSS